jgi:type II secretory pathway component PulC
VNRPDSPDDVEPVEPETLGPAVSIQTASSSETTDADFSVRQKQMEYFLNRGPSYALRHLETEPVIENDQFQGYRITAVTSAAKRHTENSLKKGDIVTRINGERLDEPKSYMSVWKSLPDRSKIKLEVRRDGNLRQITGVVR